MISDEQLRSVRLAIKSLQQVLDTHGVPVVAPAAEKSICLLDLAANVVITPSGPNVPRAELVRCLLELAAQIDGTSILTQRGTGGTFT